jgi:hypothetical protein
MKMNSRFNRGLVAAAAACALSLGAVAGTKTIQQVSINDSKSTAVGDLGYVRGTSDDVQYIGCAINGNGSAGGANGYCTARNAAGVTRSCSTNVPRWLDIIGSVNGDSRVFFRWDTDGKCTMIVVENSSTWSPKQP